MNEWMNEWMKVAAIIMVFAMLRGVCHAFFRHSRRVDSCHVSTPRRAGRPSCRAGTPYANVRNSLEKWEIQT
jgi:hypothetical protein